MDDFVLLELNEPSRLEAAEMALRLAMTLTLGHTAIHPKKFSETWEKQIHYLGLDFCLLTCTVSMPMAKIDKARGRVLDMLKGTTITKNRKNTGISQTCLSMHTGSKTFLSKASKR